MSKAAGIQGRETPGDMQFHRQDWLPQRIAWLVMLAVVAEALAGLLGRDALSRRGGARATPDRQ